MDLQHVNVKLLVRDPDKVKWDALIPVFHSWIEDQVMDELLLDVADYRHVPSGPGIVVIGHQANYSVDASDGRVGVRYNRKAAAEGSQEDRLWQAVRAAASACQRLEEEGRLGGSIRFNGREMEFFINDRLLVPNTDSARKQFAGEIESFFGKLFGSSEYTITHDIDPRRRFGFAVRSSKAFSTADLLAAADSHLQPQP
jgi:hypothetical protein